MAKGNPNPTSGWKKGQSGNPSGRPKDVKEIAKLARTYAPEAIKKLAEWMQSSDANVSIKACNALLDRGLGKAPQIISGDEDNPVNVNVSLDEFTRRIARIAARADEEAGNRDAE